MALAQGNTVVTKYVAEVTPGVIPAAAMTKLRTKTANINGNVTTVQSQEIRSDRAIADLVRTQGTTTGDIGFELSFAEYEPFIAAALGGTWSTLVNVTGTNISAAAADNSINHATSGFPATISAGHWLKVTGLAQGTKIGKVVSATTAKIVLSHCTLTTEAAGASVTVKGKSVRNGNTEPTFIIEREFVGLTPAVFAVHKGMRVNTMNLNVASGAILEGTFGLMGQDTVMQSVTAGTGAEVAASTNPLMAANANVGSIYVDGTALSGTYAKSANLSLNNNARNLDAIGSLFPVDVNYGTLTATVAMEVFFNDTSLLTKFLNGTNFSLAYYATDSAGNAIVIDIPYAKFNTGTLTGVQLNSDVMQSLNATALLSPTLGYMVQVSAL